MRILLLLGFILLMNSPIQAQFKLYQNKCGKKMSIKWGNQAKEIIGFDGDRAFLTIAKSDPKVSYKMASFHFKERIQERCTRQVVENVESNREKVIIEGKFEDCACNWTISLDKDTTAQIRLRVKLSDTTYNRIYLTYTSDETEQFFGFGEQYSYVNMKGKKPLIFVEEQGLGRGDKGITTLAKLVKVAGNEYTSYAPIPFYLTSFNRGMWVENTSLTEFDLTSPDKVKLSIWNHELSALLWVEDHPLDIIEKYTLKTGRMRSLPDWAYGTWLGLQGGATTVKQVVKQALDAGNPVTAIWIQDWVGRRKTRFGSQLWWIWEPSEKDYPNFPVFCDTLNSWGVEVTGYINSFSANEGKFCEEGLEKGYFIKNQKGEDYLLATAGFPAYLVDLSNPAAYNWVKEIIKNNLIANGLSGWMADFSEWLPWDAQLHSGESAEQYHNRYPVIWAKLNREAIEEAGKGDEIVFFTRAGYSESNRYSTLFWAGDQMTTWGLNDGIASVIPAMLSSGMSGIALNHFDIGGYTNVNFPFYKINREQELFYRWTELAAFTPVFRTHEGLIPQKNYQPYTDQETVDFFAKLGKFHYQLKDYFKLCMEEHTQKGWPILRHLYLHYPHDPNTYRLPYQFLVGADLLVLPVIEKSQNKVKGYFPEGKWQHIWTKKIYEGSNWHTVDAPLGQPAAFIKVGGEQEELLKKCLF